MNVKYVTLLALSALFAVPAASAEEVCKNCVTNPDNMIPELVLPTDVVAVMPGDNVAVMPGDNVADGDVLDLTVRSKPHVNIPEPERGV